MTERSAQPPSDWERCAPWIEAALQRGEGTHLLEDVEAMCRNGEAQLWAGVKSAAVTEVQDFPRVKRMHLWLCGGDLNEIIDHMLPVAEAWGRSIGCLQFTTAGRPGWDRVMAKKGYRPAGRVCVKDMRDEP